MSIELDANGNPIAAGSSADANAGSSPDIKNNDGKGDKDKLPPTHIPKSRFDEVIAERNQTREELAAAKEQALRAQEALLEHQQKILEMDSKLREIESNKNVPSAIDPNIFSTPADPLVKQHDSEIKGLKYDVEKGKSDTKKSELKTAYNNDPILQKKWKSYDDMEKEMMNIARSAGYKGDFLTDRAYDASFSTLITRNRTEFNTLAKQLGAEEATAQREMAANGGLPGSSSKTNVKTNNGELTQNHKDAARRMGVSEETYKRGMGRTEYMGTIKEDSNE